MDEGNQAFPQADSAALLVIEFPSFRDFIDAYSPIISEEGIFIRNTDVSESNAFSVGDRVEFEVRLKDDFRLIQGAGEVVWLGPSVAAEGASGTAIRFLDVDEPSRRLISRLVGNYVRDGGKLFEVGSRAAGDAPDEAEAGEDAAPAEEAVVDSQLTAENLEPSEADALFADDAGDALESRDEDPVEIESMSLEDVEGDGAMSSPLDQPVGLETIAIPAGLVAAEASEPPPALEAEQDSKPADSEPLDVEEALSFDPGAEGESVEVDPAPALTVPESIDIASGDEPAGTEAALSAGEDALADTPEVSIGDELDDASLEAAADSMDENFSRQGAMPEEIAQVAEELSGVHRYDLPELGEAGESHYAGAASIGAERNTGGRIAALVVAFVLLGAGAFYFGDAILGFFGLGGEDPDSVAVVREGETMPMPSESASAPSSDTAGAGVPTADAGAPDAAEDAEATGETAASDAGQGAASAETEPASAAVANEPTRSGTAAGSAAKPVSAPRESSRSPAPPPVATGTAVSRVERITWREDGDETIVTIRLDAAISSAGFEVVRVRNGAPREVIKLLGVRAPYAPPEVMVGSRQVIRLRTGLHQTGSGSALHVVADLTGTGVTVRSVEPSGRDLEITFS